MAACKNSANPNGPVTRSRIKPSFFICYTLERLWPLPQPKRLRCDIVHGHLGGRRGPTAGVGPESGAFSSICSQFECFVSLCTLDLYLTVPFGHCNWLQYFTTNFFFTSSGFPEDFKTEDRKIHWSLAHQCEHFVGTSPTKNAHKIFKNFGKVLCPNISKNIFSILGQKTMQINVFWSQGYGKIVFFDQKPNLKIFNFCKFFSIFFSKYFQVFTPFLQIFITFNDY